jgi:HK97 family phage portal protein
MRVPAVAAAVQLISSTVGTLPAKVFVRSDDGTKVGDFDHPAFQLVHTDANDWTSAAQLRSQLTIDALLHGNGYAFANRVNGRVVEFIRLAPETITILADSATGEPLYRVSSTEGQKIYALREILHIPALLVDGLCGVSPVHLAREAIGLALTLEQHAARLFGRGGRPSGVLKFPNKLGSETAQRISQSWHTAHAGDASGKTAVLEEGGDFVPLTFNSVDLQFLELRKWQINEIARAFRVAPTLLMELDRATWSNSEELGRQFLQFSILPWLRTWESSYRRVLLNPDERRTHSIEFIVDDLLRADTATRAEAYARFRSMGVMTANEVRELENLPARADGDKLENPFTTTSSRSTPA